VAADESGELIAERNAYLGDATNNVAEYEAVLLALALAEELGVGDVEIVNDSELVARQIGGEYRVKQEHLKPLHKEAMTRLRRFDRWAVRSVRREHNVRADELVNEALDAKRSTTS
jgi:ribonuclease HI